jgi:hypothetical protein
MRLKRLATADLAANLMNSPVLAETTLPRLQAADPVFAKHAIKSRPSICNGVADYGATIELTVQMAFVDPLFNIAEDLARLFRPFFTDAKTTGESARTPRTSKNSRAQSPSKMVQMAARKRLCG